MGKGKGKGKGKKKGKCVADHSSQGKYKIEDIPLNHVKKFCLNSDSLGSHMEYLMLLTWIRTMCCMKGTVFDGIPNVNHCKDHPFIMIEIIHRGMSSKLLISKKDLYLVAFTYNEKWYALANLTFVHIEDVQQLSKNEMYEIKPFEQVGPKELSNAMYKFKTYYNNNNDDKKKKKKKDDNSEYSVKEGCEIMMVHICEASRFTPIQHLIVQAFAKSKISAVDFDVNEEDLMNGLDEIMISDKLDIYSSIKPEYSIDYTISLGTSDQVRNFINKYDNLSKIWYAYSLTGRRFFDVNDDDRRKFGIKNVRSLRSILAVLWNLDSPEDFVNELEKKIKNHGSYEFTDDFYESMKEKVLKLKNDGKFGINDS